jgi:hypothetical protein
MTPEPTGPAPRAAAAALNVEPDAPRDRVRTAFLGRLAEELVPEPRLRAAAAELGLTAAGSAARAALDADVGRDLSSAIEDFAASYWELAPAARQERWEHLRQEAGRHPRLVARLEDLAGGLDFTPPTDIADPADSQLAEIVAEIYPLRPAARARRRAQLIPQIGPPAARRRSAQALRRIHPELERIDHGLLEALSFIRPPVQPIRSARPRRREREPEQPEPTTGSIPRWVWLLIPACLSVCSGLSRMGRTTNDFVTSPQPTYVSPQADRDRIAKATGVRPETYDNLAKTLAQTRTVKVGLTSTQRKILVSLIGRTELSETDAEKMATWFVLSNESRGSTVSFDPVLTLPPDPRLTAEQRVIWDQLAHTTGPTENGVRGSLIAFVKAGQRATERPARP